MPGAIERRFGTPFFLLSSALIPFGLINEFRSDNSLDGFSCTGFNITMPPPVALHLGEHHDCHELDQHL
jgi:hypothetical protein